MQTALATPELPRLTLAIPAVHASALVVICRSCGTEHTDHNGCPQCQGQTLHVAVIRPLVNA